MLRAQREFLVQTNPPQTIAAPKLSISPLSEAVRVQTPSDSFSLFFFFFFFFFCFFFFLSAGETTRERFLDRSLLADWSDHTSHMLFLLARLYRQTQLEQLFDSLQVKGHFNHFNVRPARPVYKDTFNTHATEKKHN